jgi:hypothetical protein
MIARRSLLAALTLVAAVAVPRTASAQIEEHLKNKFGIETHNTFKNRSVWVTIYNQINTIQMDYGCIKPGQARKWTSRAAASAASGGIAVNVRGQVMETADCKGKEFCDTSIEVNKSTGATIYMHTNPQVTDPKKQCYWDRRSTPLQVD